MHVILESSGICQLSRHIQSFVLKMCKKKDVIIASSFETTRIEKESVKTVVMILAKRAILICFVLNNVELNIKWNMTENNDMFNTVRY